MPRDPSNPDILMALNYLQSHLATVNPTQAMSGQVQGYNMPSNASFPIQGGYQTNMYPQSNQGYGQYDDQGRKNYGGAGGYQQDRFRNNSGYNKGSDRGGGDRGDRSRDDRGHRGDRSDRNDRGGDRRGGGYNNDNRRRNDNFSRDRKERRSRSRSRSFERGPRNDRRGGGFGNNNYNKDREGRSGGGRDNFDRSNDRYPRGSR